jgi:anaerobic magnesium-protoporphyrin IX monomethyl ester cyclase
MGLEPGSDKTLNYLKGKAFSVQKNRQAIEILKNHGITGNASFVIGSPEETLDEIMETFRFIKESPVCLVDVYVLTPYPGTPIWDYALSQELVSNDMDWERLNVNFEVSYQNIILLSQQLSEMRW